MLYIQIIKRFMAKSRDDEIYERGVHMGQNANLLQQFADNLAPVITRDDEIFQKGYDYGVSHKSEEEEDRKDSEEKSNSDSVDIDDDDDDSSSSSSSDSSYGDYSYSSSGDSGSYSSPSSSTSTSSSPKKEKVDPFAAFVVNVVGIGLMGIVGSIVYTVNSRKDILAPPVSQQIRQSYHESMFFRSDAGLKPVAPDQAYQGQGSIELHYPLSRTDKDLEAIVVIPVEELELRDIQYWEGNIHYQRWKGEIGKRFDTNEDKFLSYDEIATMYDAMGKELTTILYQEKVFRNLEGKNGGPNTAPAFYQDTQARTFNKENLEKFRIDPHRASKRVLNMYRVNND